MTPGIHLLHKPVGPTSFSLVQTYLERARREQPQHPPKICHGGTLDPFASGLLLMLVGPATKLFDYLHDVPKVYEATVKWGTETDNGDPLGKPIFSGDPSALTPHRIDTALQTFVGWHDQIPPATSNKRIAGERAYTKAHRGEVVDLPPSRVYLHEATWISHDLPTSSRVRLVTRGGYYVRSLARDLGRMLACGAHLSQLHRAAIGPWSDPDEHQGNELTGSKLLPWLSSRALTDQEVGQLRAASTISRGTLTPPPQWSLPTGFPPPTELIRGMHQDRLLFLLSPENGAFRPIVSLGRGA